MENSYILLHFNIYNVAREGEELLQVSLRSLQRNITDLNCGYLQIKITRKGIQLVP